MFLAYGSLMSITKVNDAVARMQKMLELKDRFKLTALQGEALAQYIDACSTHALQTEVIDLSDEDCDASAAGDHIMSS